VLAIHADFNAAVPLDLAIETHAQIPSEESSSNGVTVNEAINWPQLIQAFKDHKLSSGAIKQSTWDGICWRRMAVILEAVGGKRRPVSSKQLLAGVIESWKDRPGSRGRQLQVQFTAALLRWGVDSERLPSSWAPHRHDSWRQHFDLTACRRCDQVMELKTLGPLCVSGHSGNNCARSTKRRAKAGSLFLPPRLCTSRSRHLRASPKGCRRSHGPLSGNPSSGLQPLVR
jgi:hypothetical protein